MNSISITNAGAGTGKTYHLTHKLRDEIRGGVPASGFIATTFTVKAASELRERVRALLLAEGMHREAEQIFEGYIGTVNSVCANLLSEFCIDAGLSPALQVVPQEHMERRFRYAVAQVIEQRAPEIEPAAHRLELQGGGNPYQRNDDWREAVHQLVDAARSNGMGAEALQGFAESSWSCYQQLLGPAGTTALVPALRNEAEKARRQLASITAPKKKTAEALSKLSDFLRESEQPQVLRWSWLSRLSRLEAAKDGDEFLEPLRLTAAELSTDPEYQSDLRAVIQTVFQCAAQALEAYDAYKRAHGLMDFVDQETGVLELARENQSFREYLSQTVSLVAVDEFQDTSPLQLAVFLRLHEICGRSLWVGDPKQAIYGFRGTDPQLMKAAVQEIGTGPALKDSWRSRRRVVEFINAVFEQPFAQRGYTDVELSISPQRTKGDVEGGELEQWALLASNAAETAAALAQGVAELLSSRAKWTAGDVAVLCRTNNDCKALAAELEARGIPASFPQGKLMGVAEVQLVLAALRYICDPDDTVALLELAHLGPDRVSGGNPFDGLPAGADQATQARLAKQAWRELPTVQGLHAARPLFAQLNPLEALEEAVALSGVLELIESWGDVGRRRLHLDALRGACAVFMDGCRTRSHAATLLGFLRELIETDPPLPESLGAHAVTVTTYHKAKGLQWPVVVLSSLDKAAAGHIFGATVEEAPQFDLKDPLAGRRLRYLPPPCGASNAPPEFQDRIDLSEQMLLAQARATEESLRLLYVGITRAQDMLVFAVRKKETQARGAELMSDWLNELCDANGTPLLTLSLQSGRQDISVGGTPCTFEVREYGPDAAGAGPAAAAAPPLAPRLDAANTPQATTSTPTHAPARISASEPANTSDGANGTFTQAVLHADLGERLSLPGAQSDADLGNAVHGFLGAAPAAAGDPGQLAGIAQRYIDRYLPGGDTAVLLEIHRRLEQHLQHAYPGAGFEHEWPVTLRTGEHRLMQGYIDLLIRTSTGGLVLLDHKTYRGTNPATHAMRYAQQLELYSTALTRAEPPATDAPGSVPPATEHPPVNSCFIHFPLLGKIYRLETGR